MLWTEQLPVRILLLLIVYLSSQPYSDLPHNSMLVCWPISSRTFILRMGKLSVPRKTCSLERPKSSTLRVLIPLAFTLKSKMTPPSMTRCTRSASNYTRRSTSTTWACCISSWESSDLLPFRSQKHWNSWKLRLTVTCLIRRKWPINLLQVKSTFKLKLDPRRQKKNRVQWLVIHKTMLTLSPVWRLMSLFQTSLHNAVLRFSSTWDYPSSKTANGSRHSEHLKKVLIYLKTTLPCGTI